MATRLKEIDSHSKLMDNEEKALKKKASIIIRTKIHSLLLNKTYYTFLILIFQYFCMLELQYKTERSRKKN